MSSPFEIVVQRLVDLGFYNFVFPFIITSAIFYALLRKTKIFGESIVVNAVVSLSIAFMIFGYPVIAGISLTTPLSVFFTQATVWLLIIFVGFILASLFYPNLSEMLTRTMAHRTTLFMMIALAIVLFVTSGLITVFTGTFNQPPKPGAPPSTPTDVILIIAGLIIFIVLLLIATGIARVGSP